MNVSVPNGRVHFALRLGTAVAAASAWLSAPECEATVVPLNPKATYLHTASADSAAPATPILLADLAIVPGDRIQLRRLGDFDNGPQGDTFTTMIAVFSAGDVLLPGSAQHRVPGALNAGVDLVSAATYYGSEPTDIPEDFVISSGTFPSGVICVVVPAGATHLFVAPHDSLYEDNSDPDGDWGVEITLLSVCAGDLDGSGEVSGADLGILLAGWGVLDEIGGPGDIDCDGDVDGGDLGLLLSSWGQCAERR